MPSDTPRDAYVTVILSPGEKKRVEKVAEDDRMTLSGWCRREILKAVDRVETTTAREL